MEAFYVLLTYLCLQYTYASVPLLTATSPSHPIREGGVLAIRFQIWNLPSNHIIAISRTIDSGLTSETLTWKNIILPGDNDNVFLSVRHHSDSSVVYLLFVLNVKRRESGAYVCQVLSSPGNEVTSKTVNVDVEYFPTQMPSCTPVKSVEAHIGTTLSLNCSTTKGNPLVAIQWRTSGSSKSLPATLTETEDLVQSMVNVTITEDHGGSVFTCQITSYSFPELEQTCRVGPLVVLEKLKTTSLVSTTNTTSPSTNITNHTQSTESGATIGKDTIMKGKANFLETIFKVKSHWIIAVLVTVSASLVFLTVDVVLFIRLRHIDTFDDAQTLYTAPTILIQDDYVEFGDDKRIYMTLDRPYMTRSRSLPGTHPANPGLQEISSEPL